MPNAKWVLTVVAISAVTTAVLVYLAKKNETAAKVFPGPLKAAA